MNDQQSSCAMGQWTVSLLAAAVCSLVLFAVFTGYISKMQDSLTEQSMRLDAVQQRLIQTETQLTDLQRALTMPPRDSMADGSVPPDAAPADMNAPAPMLPAAPGVDPAMMAPVAPPVAPSVVPPAVAPAAASGAVTAPVMPSMTPPMIAPAAPAAGVPTTVPATTQK